MPSNRSFKPESGFTLVELLVAMATIALISAFTWRGVDAMSETSERARSRSESLLSISRSAERLRDDLDALECNVGKAPPPEQAEGLPSPSAPEEPNMIDAIEFGSPLPSRFALWTRRLDPPQASGIQVVAWFSHVQPTGQMVLARWASAPLATSSQWRSALSSARKLATYPNRTFQDGESIELFHAASSIQFEKIMQNNSWQAGTPTLPCPSRIPNREFPSLSLQATLSLVPSFDMSGVVQIVWTSPLITGSPP